MLGIIDAEKLGYPVVNVPGAAAAGGADGCPRCEAFRPAPELSGNLRVGPEIHLPSVGMDVDIAYYYNANSNCNGPFRYGRTLSTNLGAQASGSPLVVTLTRGNGNVAVYSDNGSGTFAPQTHELTNTLVKNTSAGCGRTRC